METVQTVHTQTNGTAFADLHGAIKRVSWGAVFAGVVVALVLQLALGILGLGIGASTVDPLTERNPVEGLGTGAGVWFVVSALIALFAGGAVAGRLSGVPRRMDRVLHGILTWGLTMLVTLYLLTTAAGSVLGGTARVLGRSLALVGQGVGAIAPPVGRAAGDELGRRGIDASDIQREAEALIRQAVQPGQPGTVAQGRDEPVAVLVERMFGRAGGGNEADHDALVNALVARTTMSRPEAERTVARWEQTSQNVRARATQMRGDAERRAREAGDVAARGVSKAALWMFAMMALGAAAAAAGSALSARRDREVDDAPPATPTRHLHVEPLGT